MHCSVRDTYLKRNDCADQGSHKSYSYFALENTVTSGTPTYRSIYALYTASQKCPHFVFRL